MNRKEWLSSLKTGDKVANKKYGRYGSGYWYEIVTVKKITPKGGIRLENGILLSTEGKYYKNEGWGDSIRYDIEPVTAEILEYNRKRTERAITVREVRDLIEEFNSNDYSIDELNKIKLAFRKDY